MMVSVAAYVSWNPMSKRLDGIGEEKGEGAGRDRVQDVDVLPEKPPAEEGQGHERGPEHGRAALDKGGVEDEEDAQGQARRPP